MSCLRFYCVVSTRFFVLNERWKCLWWSNVWFVAPNVWKFWNLEMTALDGLMWCCLASMALSFSYVSSINTVRFWDVLSWFVRCFRLFMTFWRHLSDVHKRFKRRPKDDSKTHAFVSEGIYNLYTVSNFMTDTGVNFIFFSPKVIKIDLSTWWT